jgi:hypothetical protein
MAVLTQQWLLGRRFDLVDALAPCESPLEAALCVALLCAEDGAGPFLRLRHPGEVGALARGRAGEMFLQHEIVIAGRNIRLDVAILSTKRLAIEVDGFDFHDRTGDQATRDKSRDRALLAAGWTPLRFSGAEVNADPTGCAAEVMGLLGFRPGKPAPAPIVAAATPPDPGLAKIKEADASGDWDSVKALLQEKSAAARRKAGLQ